MSDESRATIVADSVDGLNWQEWLNGAFLLATDVGEGFRPVKELLDHIAEWWYAALDDETPLIVHGADESLS